MKLHISQWRHKNKPHWSYVWKWSGPDALNNRCGVRRLYRYARTNGVDRVDARRIIMRSMCLGSDSSSYRVVQGKS